MLESQEMLLNEIGMSSNRYDYWIHNLVSAALTMHFLFISEINVPQDVSCNH